MLHQLEVGDIELVQIGGDAAGSIADFLRRYRKVSPDLADACLVHIAERYNIDTVFTLDRRDFSIYRFNKNRPFTLLPA